MDSKENKNGKSFYLILFFVLCIIILSVFFIFWCAVEQKISFPTTDKISFGDRFDALSALFTGLAFAGIIVTILYQRHQLKLQHEEIMSAKFDNTFFNMLKTLKHSIESSILIIDDKIIKGRECFVIAYEDISLALDDKKIKSLKESINNKDKFFELYYDYLNDIFEKKYLFIEHCFRNILYIILHIVDECPSAKSNQGKYFNFLESQMSGVELCLFFYLLIYVCNTEKLSDWQKQLLDIIDEANFFIIIGEFKVDELFFQFFPKTFPKHAPKN